jgi:hypothetical protein
MAKTGKLILGLGQQNAKDSTGTYCTGTVTN